MNLAFLSLKAILPSLNERVIESADILREIEKRNATFAELDLKQNGYYLTDGNRDFIFLKRALEKLLFEETLAHEFSHLCLHYPAPFLLRKQQIEAEALALICMLPLPDLPRLNRIKHQLDRESYNLIERRNKVYKIWEL